jgi:hypothetical protein
VIHRGLPYLETFGLLQWISAHPVRAHLICWGIALVAYLFYAPYKLYSRLDKRLAVLEERRPSYEYFNGWVQPTLIVDKRPQPTAAATAFLQLKNMGTVTAYNPKVTIWYCWIDSPSEIQKVERESFGRNPVHQPFTVDFSVEKPAVHYNGLPPGESDWNFDSRDEVIVWFQSEAAAGAPDGPVFTDDIQRFCFIPYDYRFNPKAWSWQSSRHQKIAESHFQEFRRKERESGSTPPPLSASDTAGPPQSTT